MSDFFNWEDLDLDKLLREYTDGDMCEFDSSDSSCESDVESVNWSDVVVKTRRPASADRTARAANFRRDL